jgi:TonB family protein
MGLALLVVFLFLLGAGGTGFGVWLFLGQGDAADGSAVVAANQPSLQHATAELPDRTAEEPVVLAQNTDAQNADAQNADAQNADAQNADAQNADAQNADAQNADAQNADAQNADAQNADAQNADAQNADAQNGDAQNAGPSEEAPGRRRNRRDRDDREQPAEPQVAAQAQPAQPQPLAPQQPRPQIVAPPPAPRTGLSQQQLLGGIQSQAAALNERCYQRRLARVPGLGGVITVAWNVRPDGRVEGARVVHNGTGDEWLGRCTLQIVERARFPAAANGQPTPGRYAFFFRPAPGR